MISEMNGVGQVALLKSTATRLVHVDVSFYLSLGVMSTHFAPSIREQAFSARLLTLVYLLVPLELGTSTKRLEFELSAKD